MKCVLVLMVAALSLVALAWPTGTRATVRPTQSPSPTATQIGTLEGVVSTTAINGTYAYVGGNDGFFVLDVAAALQPRYVGYTPLRAAVRDIRVANTTAYVTTSSSDGSSGQLLIFDVRDGAKPTLLGTYAITNSPVHLEVDGTTAYLLVDDTLLVVDVANPATPTLRGSIVTDLRGATSMDVENGFVHLTMQVNNAPGKWRIIDVRAPTQPTLRAQYDAPNEGITVQVRGNYAYFTGADSAYNFHIVDISNIDRPQVRSSMKLGGFALRLRVAGNYAYVTNAAYGLQIVDITNPAQPTLRGTYLAPRASSYNGVNVVGNRVYVDDSSYGLDIIDTNDPAQPALSGTYATYGYLGDARVEGNLLYAAGGTAGLRIVDISDPANPQPRGQLIPPPEEGWFISKLHVANGWAYLMDFSRIIVVDVRNPEAPQRVGSYQLVDEAFFKDIEVAGTITYVADQFTGLRIIDVSDPANPTLRGTYAPANGAAVLDVAVAGTTAYVVDQNQGVLIVDVSDPAKPTLRGTYRPTQPAARVHVANGIAYVSSACAQAQQCQLDLLDVRNAAQPKRLSTYTMPGSTSSVQVQGTLAYVVTGTGFLDQTSELQVLDISRPQMPGVRTTQPLQRRALPTFSVAGSLIVVPSGGSGLQLLRLQAGKAYTRIMLPIVQR